MENMEIESSSHEDNNDPKTLGKRFNTEDSYAFTTYLHRIIKSYPSTRFTIIADWVSVDKVRSAKGLLDLYASRLHIDSITIRATRRQYEEDVNAFESGVKWEEIQEV